MVNQGKQCLQALHSQKENNAYKHCTRRKKIMLARIVFFLREYLSNRQISLLPTYHYEVARVSRMQINESFMMDIKVLLIQ